MKVDEAMPVDGVDGQIGVEFQRAPGPLLRRQAGRRRAYPAFLAIDRLADRLPHHFLAGAVQRLGETMESRRVECRLGFLARRSEEHTSELQSLMRISYAVLCLK